MSENRAEAPIRVLLLLKNRLLRDAVNRLVGRRPDLVVVGSNTQEDCPPQTVIDSQCDVFVLDFLDARWLPANLLLKASHCSMPKCLLIGMDQDLDQFDIAIRGGAIGYLLKDATVSDLVGAIRGTVRGEATCPPKLCAALFQRFSQTTRAGEPGTVSTQRPSLTLRQQRLVAFVANGLTNKEIASQMNLSQFTVRNHVHRIMKRFGVESRSQAVCAILSHGYELKGDKDPPTLRQRTHFRLNSSL